MSNEKANPLECCSIRAGNGNGVGFTGGHHFQTSVYP